MTNAIKKISNVKWIWKIPIAIFILYSTYYLYIYNAWRFFDHDIKFSKSIYLENKNGRSNYAVLKNNKISIKFFEIDSGIDSNLTNYRTGYTPPIQMGLKLTGYMPITATTCSEIVGLPAGGSESVDYHPHYFITQLKIDFFDDDGFLLNTKYFGNFDIFQNSPFDFNISPSVETELDRDILVKSRKIVLSLRRTGECRYNGENTSYRGNKNY